APARPLALRPDRAPGLHDRRRLLRARHQPAARVPHGALRRGQRVRRPAAGDPARGRSPAGADNGCREGRQPGLRDPAASARLAATSRLCPRLGDDRAPRGAHPSPGRARGRLLLPAEGAVPEQRPDRGARRRLRLDAGHVPRSGRRAPRAVRRDARGDRFQPARLRGRGGARQERRARARERDGRRPQGGRAGGQDQPELRARQQGDGGDGERLPRGLRARRHRPHPRGGDLPGLAREALDHTRARARPLPEDDRAPQAGRRDQGLRGGEMSQSQYPPISDYALLSDCHSGALVSKDGSIDWCAFHRCEARPVFARILDWRKGGFFRVAPKGDYEVTRRYIPGTNVLETRFETSDGVILLTDCLVVRTEEGHPDHRLIRRVQCMEGEVAVKVKFEPRFDYGLTEPRVEVLSEDLAIAYGGPDALILQTELPIGTAETSACDAARTMKKGDDAFIVLTWELPQELKPERLPRELVAGELEGTIGFWQMWSERCGYDGPYRDEVLRSALVLKALTNEPTGAIVAAPTTSLPEEIGGERNWDYRYSWLRDSALTLNALFSLGYTEEAHAYMAWLRRTTAGRAHALQIMY